MTAKTYGYMRTSTATQSMELQVAALKKRNCDEMFEDIVSGSKSDRPGYTLMLSKLREGDTVIVWKLDRLGRSLSDLISKVNHLKSLGVGFVSITENMDTTTTTGRLLFNIVGSLAEFEKDLIRERTVAGLKAARARGRLGGRPKSLSKQKVQLLIAMHKDLTTPVSEILETLNISKSTMYKYLRENTGKDGS